jgi:hypothetical protein
MFLWQTIKEDDQGSVRIKDSNYHANESGTIIEYK